MNIRGPSIDAIKALRKDLGSAIVRTPILQCAALEDLIGRNTSVHAKLEFLQQTGTFKARGALANLRSLNDEQLRAGVTAVSAGNHAIATAFAARASGTTAKVVMMRSASPARITACRKYGAQIVLADDVHTAFEIAGRIEAEEGRFFVHPFEGPFVAAGTGTVGLEVCEQCDDFDAVLVPVGGGGLIAGMANAIKQLRSQAAIIGVEPEGADSMLKSFASGRPEGIDKVRTIADSLGAPFAAPYSFELCRQHVDRLVVITDEQIRRAMGYLFSSMKMAVEPACAATTAALLGPLRRELSGRRVILTMCGSNIDWSTFAEQAIFREDDVN